LYRQLQPYWHSYGVNPDPVAIALGQEIALNCQQNPLTFLGTLTQRLYEDCDYTLREHGQPWEAGITWGQKQGSCRDLTVLFMEVCRTVGLAARFVSGYQEGDQSTEDWELHAWAEVYLPGGGWRGYDPTHGLAVSDRHIALVASPIPAYCAPIAGEITPVRPIWETGQPPSSQMHSRVKVSVINSQQQSQSQ
ncbi:MAG: transglutaminase-like domain-containing protein, partial [Microcystaceae cyanobacterium]